MVSEHTLTNVNIPSTSTTPMATISTGIPIIVANPPAPPPLITFNHFNPLKLTPGNYNNYWLPQIVPHLKGGNLFKYVDGTHYSPPPSLVTTTDGVVLVSPNPYFLTGKCRTS